MGLTRRDLLAKGALLGAAAVGVARTDALAGAPVRASASADGAEPLPWDMFRCAAWNDGTLFAFGSVVSKAAETGEIMEVVRRVRERTGNPANPTRSDFDVFVSEWQRMAARLERQARSALAAGRTVTARGRFLRASTYRAQALFFVLGTSRPGREAACFRASEDDWLRALALWDVPVEQMTITANGIAMPAYFFRPAADGARRPTYIVCNGSDGQNVDVLCEGITAALDRGYNVITFEAPGQMSLLFEQRIPFASNWAPIMDAVVTAVSARPDVDSSRIAATGVSLLGMVIASAANTPGLRAVVLQPGAYSLPRAWEDQDLIAAVEETMDAPARVRRGAEAEVNAGMAQAWKGMGTATRFTVHKRTEIYTRQALADARAGRPPSDYYGVLEAILAFRYQDDLRAVTTPTLVCSNQLDEFFGTQPREAYGMLTSLPASAKFLQPLTISMGAQFHDQPLGPQVAQELILDWVDATLGL